MLMKIIYLSVAAIIFISMVLFPLFSMKPSEKSASGIKSSLASSKTDSTETIKVLRTGTNEVETMSLTDYLVGVVIAEMPTEYHEEALKAQAVAACTFAKHRQLERENGEYDVTDSPASDQAFLDEASQKDKLSKSYETSVAKVKAAVSAVAGQTVTFDGQPILALYHDTSGGRTESMENVFGEALPYLVPVLSVGDLTNPNLKSTVTVTKDELTEKLKSAGLNTDGKDVNDIKLTKSDSGTVLTVTLGDSFISGTDVRKAFSLRSADFDIKFSDDTAEFTVLGYGHLVGMSQYGANYMANEGSTYPEILAWYYPGTSLTVTEK